VYFRNGYRYKHETIWTQHENSQSISGYVPYMLH
jgi:hypothetical protein